MKRRRHSVKKKGGRKRLRERENEEEYRDKESRGKDDFVVCNSKQTCEKLKMSCSPVEAGRAAVKDGVQFTASCSPVEQHNGEAG